MVRVATALPRPAVRHPEVEVDPGCPPAPSTARLLLILQSAFVGGMETHAIDLAAEYVRRGIQVKAVVPEWPKFDGLADRFESAGADVERLDTDAREGRTPQIRQWLRLMRITRAFDPQVIHLHTPGATGGLAVALIARLAARRAALVITEHDVPDDRWRRWDLLTRTTMDRFPDAVVAVSRRNAGLRTERLKSAPQHLAAVLNGVPCAQVPAGEKQNNRRRTRQQLGLQPDAVVIGSLVRLDRGKGLDDLLEAFRDVLQNCSCELLLVGDGPLRGELDQQAHALGIASHVHFAGHQAAPACFLDAMDVFVLAVPAGSMSIALLEAMGRALPAVITFCGPEEAVIPEETGLCAPPDDPRGLGRVLIRIAQDSALRDRLGQAAAEHVLRHFSVRRVADDLLELYTSARRGVIPDRLRADGPANPRPGDC